MEQCRISLEEVITYRNYFKALKDCNREVNYKFSVQEYNANCIMRITDTISCILAGGVPAVKNSTQVLIRERGKERIITPIDIADRVTQKVLCDNALIPSIAPHLIYDNGASLKGKGTAFARERFSLFMEKAKKEATTVYALTYDVKSFFGSISHRECERVLNKYVWDKRIVALCMGTIGSYEHHRDGKGICLGSQISQVMAVAVLNDFDHYIKDCLRMHYYLRYMDDGVILHRDREVLVRIMGLLRERIRDYGFVLHPRKTRVTDMHKGITFLKVRYQLQGMCTLKRLTRDGIVRERRRLKKLKYKLDAGEIPIGTVLCSMQSWDAHADAAKCWATKRNMFKLYDRLYGGYMLTRKFYRANPGTRRRKKVARF